MFWPMQSTKPALDELFIGKFSLKQVESVKALREQNYLVGPKTAARISKVESCSRSP